MFGISHCFMHVIQYFYFLFFNRFSSPLLHYCIYKVFKQYRSIFHFIRVHTKGFTVVKVTCEMADCSLRWKESGPPFLFFFNDIYSSKTYIWTGYTYKQVSQWLRQITVKILLEKDGSNLSVRYQKWIKAAELHEQNVF